MVVLGYPDFTILEEAIGGEAVKGRSLRCLVGGPAVFDDIELLIGRCANTCLKAATAILALSNRQNQP
jgi:hypothetical protein